MTIGNGAARSNDVRFKDREGLKLSLEPFDGITSSSHSDDPQKVCLWADTKDGGWPSWATIKDGAAIVTTEEIECSFQERVVPCLGDGEVIVSVEGGHEKLRYVSGYAAAYAWDGRACSLSLSDIDKLAAPSFSVPTETITTAEY